MAKTPRPDHDGRAKATFLKAKKIIYARDTICGICGRAVDYDKHFPDPWSPTIDHIIPIQKGGDPCNIENLQLAHLQCNRIKATKMVSLQVKEKNCSNQLLPLSTDWSTI